jgi:hypothetical protein
MAVQVKPFANIMAVVVAMCVNEIRFLRLRLYFSDPDLRRTSINKPVEMTPVARTPITPAAPVEKRGFSIPLTP